MVWKLVVFGFQLEIYKDLICVNHFIRNKYAKSSYDGDSKMFSRQNKFYILKMESSSSNWNIVAF